MSVYSSQYGSLRELPLMWSPRMICARGGGPDVGGNIVEEVYDQILRLGP